MPNVIDEVLGNRANGVVEQLGRQFGLDPTTTSSALSALLPALVAGVKSKASSAASVASLTSALASGEHARYVDDLSTSGQAETVQERNGILGHIFGSKEVSREVAARASAQSGVSADVLKKLLPVGAAVLMGVLAKRQSTTAGTHEAAVPEASGGLLGSLTPLLSSSPGASGVSDFAGMLGKFRRHDQ
jgi:hypothetical protein